MTSQGKRNDLKPKKPGKFTGLFAIYLLILFFTVRRCDPGSPVPV